MKQEAFWRDLAGTRDQQKMRALDHIEFLEEVIGLAVKLLDRGQADFARQLLSIAERPVIVEEVDEPLPAPEPSTPVVVPREEPDVTTTPPTNVGGVEVGGGLPIMAMPQEDQQ